MSQQRPPPIREERRRPRRRRASDAAPLAGLQELLGPGVIEALGDAFTTAKLGDIGPDKGGL